MTKWSSRHKVMRDYEQYCASSICHDHAGNSDTGAGKIEEQQASSALNKNQHLTINLMSEVCSLKNLRRAYKQVKRNKGAAGLDGMTVETMHDYFKEHIEGIRAALMSGKYRPQPILGVKIPKPGGGERQLGIPTVTDRVIQQAIAQILETVFEPGFSKSSHGFRPKRSAHDALKAASTYVSNGYVWVVDFDLEKFFD